MTMTSMAIIAVRNISGGCRVCRYSERAIVRIAIKLIAVGLISRVLHCFAEENSRPLHHDRRMHISLNAKCDARSGVLVMSGYVEATRFLH